MSLTDEIVSVLSDYSEGMSANDIRKEINIRREMKWGNDVQTISKTAINSVVYGDSRFDHKNADPPIWFLRNCVETKKEIITGNPASQKQVPSIAMREIPCVVIGSVVTYSDDNGETDEVTIVNPQEQDPVILHGIFGGIPFTPPTLTLEQLSTQVAVSSPFGTAVLGKTIGDDFEVNSCGAITRYHIEDIQNPGYLRVEKKIEETTAVSAYKEVTSTGADKISEIAAELEKLYLYRQQITTEINYLKEALANEMDSQNKPDLETEFLKITRDYSKKIGIKRTDSKMVYELLEESGYDCTEYSSTLRSKIINEMLEENGELPHWLNGLVSVTDKATVSITKR